MWFHWFQVKRTVSDRLLKQRVIDSILYHCISSKPVRRHGGVLDDIFLELSRVSDALSTTKTRRGRVGWGGMVGAGGGGIRRIQARATLTRRSSQ